VCIFDTKALCSWCIFSLLLEIWFITRKQLFAVIVEFFSVVYCKPHLGEMIYQGFVVCFLSAGTLLDNSFYIYCRK